MACYYKRRIERVEDTDPPTKKAKIYSINTPNKTREKIKLNGIFFHMQVVTGSDITLILGNFWKKIGEPKLRKNNLQLKQLDGTAIKVMGTFERTFVIKSSSK